MSLYGMVDSATNFHNQSKSALNNSQLCTMLLVQKLQNTSNCILRYINQKIFTLINLSMTSY